MAKAQHYQLAGALISHYPVDNAIGFHTTYPLDTTKLFKTLNGGMVNYYITTKNETYAIDFKGEPIRFIVPFAKSQPIG